MSKDAGTAHLDAYLAQVHRHLKGLPDAEVRETLAELRSHVLDKVGGRLTAANVEAAIAELGSPREIARVNVTERVAAEVEVRRTPFRVVRAIARLAGLSVYGAFAGFISLLGYAFAAGLLITAAVKPFAWKHAGLWVEGSADNWAYSWALGVRDGSHAGRELLGGWIIPIGLLGGLLIGWLTWRFGLYSVRRMRRTVRRPRG